MTDAAKIPGIRADPDASWQQMLDLDPALDDRIGDATNLSRLIATDNLSAYYRRSSGPAWALAGDAGHFKDPVTGNGMRDALKFGRLLGEAAAVTVHDPAELDRALRDWEAARDADTISTYHWGNRESRPGPSTPLVREVLRTFSGNDAPNLSDTFNRARPIEAIITPGRMLKGLVNALRAPDADRRSILREVVAELPAEIGARRHRLLDGFRSTRSAGTERDGWDVGSGQPPSWRPAANADDDHATPLVGAAPSDAL
jgi:hypothetical protein